MPWAPWGRQRGAGAQDQRRITWGPEKGQPTILQLAYWVTLGKLLSFSWQLCTQDVFCLVHPFAGLTLCLSSEESACYAEDTGLMPRSGRSTGEGNGNPLQYPCLENPMDRGPWWVEVHGVTRFRLDLATKQNQYLSAASLLLQD